jgi:CreA protein
MTSHYQRSVLVLSALTLAAGAAFAQARPVGAVEVDKMGNEIKLSALADPEVKGVTCHFTNFERGTASRLIGMVGGRNPFADPSNTSIACRQTGPIEIGNIDMSAKGKDIFDQKASLIFKDIAVVRYFDCASNTLIYLSHSRQIIEGSAKNSVSTVPLYAANPVWKNGAPACLKQ